MPPENPSPSASPTPAKRDWRRDPYYMHSTKDLAKEYARYAEDVAQTEVLGFTEKIPNADTLSLRRSQMAAWRESIVRRHPEMDDPGILSMGRQAARLDGLMSGISWSDAPGGEPGFHVENSARVRVHLLDGWMIPGGGGTQCKEELTFLAKVAPLNHVYAKAPPPALDRDYAQARQVAEDLNTFVYDRQYKEEKRAHWGEARKIMEGDIVEVNLPPHKGKSILAVRGAGYGEWIMLPVAELAPLQAIHSPLGRSNTAAVMAGYHEAAALQREIAQLRYEMDPGYDPYAEEPTPNFRRRPPSEILRDAAQRPPSPTPDLGPEIG